MKATDAGIGKEDNHSIQQHETSCLWCFISYNSLRWLNPSKYIDAQSPAVACRDLWRPGANSIKLLNWMSPPPHPYVSDNICFGMATSTHISGGCPVSLSHSPPLQDTGLSPATGKGIDADHCCCMLLANLLESSPQTLYLAGAPMWYRCVRVFMN